MKGYYCYKLGIIYLIDKCYVGYYCIEGVSVLIFNDIVIGVFCLVGFFCIVGLYRLELCLEGIYGLNERL